jgi:hypothetical protein
VDSKFLRHFTHSDGKYNRTYKKKSAHHCIYGHFTATHGHQFSTAIHFLKLSHLRKEAETATTWPRCSRKLRKKSAMLDQLTKPTVHIPISSP